MQFKQSVRILGEILADAEVKPETVFAVARLLTDERRRLPKLGPYRKRGVEQMLWRFASDSTRNPVLRWMALRKLLALELHGESHLEKGTQPSK